MFVTFLGIAVISLYSCPTLQHCPEEIFDKGLSVTWQQSLTASNVESDPLCYNDNRLITRNCNNTEWSPALNSLEPCLKVVKYFDLSSCPPGFHQISTSNNDYCYQINESSIWNFPCFKSGGASVITDLEASEIESLLKSLIAKNISRYFWLPAQRQKLFNPLVWYIPGPNWGRPVENSNNLRIYTSIMKNCLLLDTVQRIIITETCNKEYPSLCFYINNLQYPGKCPEGYHTFRFMPDEGSCFGIEQSDNTLGLTFQDFLKSKCNKPMGDSKYNDYLTRFVFKKIAELNKLSDSTWCWFNTPYVVNIDNGFHVQEIQNENNLNDTELKFNSLEGTINNDGTLSLMNKMSTLPCMACETEIILEETELMFEYNDLEKIMYLTVYFPSGLWKYDQNDKGIQCFSNAKGFVRVVEINDLPFIEVSIAETIVPQRQNRDSYDLVNAEKIVYVIQPVTERSAQYWCEGHTKNFSLITTKKIIVNPQGNKEHVFSLIIKKYIFANEGQDIPDMSSLIANITNIFNANKVLVMDILEYTLDYMLVLMHLHVAMNDIHEDEVKNLQETYNILKETAELELSKHNYTFINISSSVYCLPTTTIDFFILDWELTPIGHIAAPKQFCLQANGLPVKRLCCGSYLLGGVWGDVEGHCNKNYEPSTTTTFLYNFVKGQVPENYTSSFLVDGLGFVLGDVNIIIPADIFYLSMSLQHIINIVQNDQSSVNMGDIENMVWVMDRIMDFDGSYLRLAQTLNSTNVILDSVNNIIEMLAEGNINSHDNFQHDTYQLAVKPQFIVQISYPKFNNVSGIAIAKNTDSKNFTDMSIQPLYKNTTLDDVLSIENLEVATWLPDNVLSSLRKNVNESNNGTIIDNDIHIVISIFHNDAVFQELDVNQHSVNSRIIGLSVPGFISNLEHSVPLVFKEMKHTDLDKICAYWDFQTQKSGNIPGFWAKRGCYLIETVNNLTICKCYHLTHFGQLLTSNTGNNNDVEENFNDTHAVALNIITLVGSFLSILGIVGIWLTALVFHTWRQKAGTKVLLQLSTAIALPLIFIVVFNLDSSIFIEYEGRYTVAKNMKTLCIVLGALLHYSILASFMWMLITAILQFIRYVRVLGVCRPSRFMIKFTLIGWGIPMIPVIIILMIDKENYVPNSINDPNKGPICYPNGFYLITGVVIPICVILLINVVLFILVIYAISRGPDGKMRATDIDLIGAQLRVSIFLFFLLGLTWIFGIFSFSKNLIWSYLFCLTSTLQGFVLFIYFVICDPSTRNLWITLMKPQFRVTSSRQSIVSISSG